MSVRRPAAATDPPSAAGDERVDDVRHNERPCDHCWSFVVGAVRRADAAEDRSRAAMEAEEAAEARLRERDLAIEGLRAQLRRGRSRGGS